MSNKIIAELTTMLKLGNGEPVYITDEVFTHQDDNGDRVIRHFAVSALQRHIDKINLQPITVGIDQNFVEYIKYNRGLEIVRLMGLLPVYRDKPILFAHMHDATHLIIDGHHRYVRRASDGYEDIQGIIIPESIWKNYLLDFPKEDKFINFLLGCTG